MRKIVVVLMVLAAGVGLGGCATAKINPNYTVSWTYPEIVSRYQSITDLSAETSDVSPEQITEWWDAATDAGSLPRKNYDLASFYYYKVIMADPSKLGVLSNYGTCLDNLGYQEEAIHIYNIALSFDPENEFASQSLAVLQRRQAERVRPQQATIAAAPQQQEVDVSGLYVLADSLAAMGQAIGQQGGGQVAQAPSNQNTPAQSTVDWHGTYNRRAQLLESAIGSYNRMTTTTARSGQLSTIRGYQRDLRDIRSQALRNGVRITASVLEGWNP